MKILYVGDIHVGGQQKDLDEIFIPKILSLSKETDFVMLAGDNTNGGMPSAS